MGGQESTSDLFFVFEIVCVSLCVFVNQGSARMHEIQCEYMVMTVHRIFARKTRQSFLTQKSTNVSCIFGSIYLLAKL